MASPAAPVLEQNTNPPSLIPAEGLFCPMCSSPAQARVPSPGATGLTIHLTCLDARNCNWAATVQVRWSEVLPELSFDLGGGA